MCGLNGERGVIYVLERGEKGMTFILVRSRFSASLMSPVTSFLQAQQMTYIRARRVATAIDIMGNGVMIYDDMTYIVKSHKAPDLIASLETIR